MKNVLLVGDSIRLGYEKKVAELLGPNVKVYSPDENCRFTKYALWGMFAWMEAMGNPKIDVGHFNAGIWDLHRCTADGQLFSSLEEYGRDIKRLAIQMKSYTDQVIFANIIPGGKGLDEGAKLNALINTNSDFVKVYLCDTMSNWNKDVVAYNKKSEAVMAEMGIPVNDMYSAILADTEKYISEDGIHPTEEGYDLLAQLTAARIEEKL